MLLKLRLRSKIPVCNEHNLPFSDQGEMSLADLPYIALANGSGITSGYEDGTINNPLVVFIFLHPLFSPYLDFFHISFCYFHVPIEWVGLQFSEWISALRDSNLGLKGLYLF